MAGPLIFHYQRGTSVLHRLDLRVKTLALLVYSFLVMALPAWALAPLALVLIFSWALSGLKVSDAWKGLRGFLVFILYLSALPLVGSAHWEAQAMTGALGFVRFVVLILAAHLGVSTSTPAQIAEALASLLSFLGERRARHVALAASLVVNTLPRILIRAQALKIAAQLRGARWGKNPFYLVKIWTLPLISSLMIESEALAWAIALRGWDQKTSQGERS